MSRFESALIAELLGDSSATLKAVLELRLAAYRARKGNLNAARESIRRIREDFSSTYPLSIFANINFAEAICEFFEGEIGAGIEKISRSKLLCRGLPPSDDLPAISAAWAASFYRIVQNWQRVESEFQELFSGKSLISNEADCRMSLVLGDCYQEIEEYGRADRYYSRARSKALLYGDESMLGASLYNRAAIRVFNLRLSEVSGSVADIKGCGIAVEAASAENFSQFIHDTSMPGIFDLLGGQLHLLQGEFARALEKLGGKRVEAFSRDWPAVELVRQADILLAKRVLDIISFEAARKQAREMIEGFPVDSCFGDVAISAFTLSKVLSGFDEGLDRELFHIAHVALNRHKIDRVNEKEMLARIESVVDSR